MAEKIQIVIKLPDKDEPDFYIRQSRAIDLMIGKEEISLLGNATDINALKKIKAFWDTTFEFLADYVKAESRDQALELLKHASENQIMKMVAAVGEGGTNAKAEVPPPLPEGSEETSKVTA